jgi:hypothetical protein
MQNRCLHLIPSDPVWLEIGGASPRRSGSRPHLSSLADADQCTSEEQYVLWHRIAALEVARVKKSSPQQTGERAIRAEDYARWRWAQFESGEAAL